MKVTRVIADLHVDDIASAREFYAGFLGLRLEEFNLGWVARLTSPETGAHLQLVTEDATAPAVPAVSVMVDDVDEAYAEALRRGYEILHPLQDEEWGVRRFYLRAPDGTVLNVVRERQ
ncbi:VOC family protein [Cumulibacter manganitolerans]|uniref:VOC family protein n=1 Tax=Cumulibacter manganitolerans TaxID=1884992 RepID=UPI001294BF95|nr:VOC family protein [Cumulibacter manganitolerans]